MRVLRGVLDIVYPPACLGCAGRTERASLPLCPACLRHLEPAPQMNVAARLDRLPSDWGTISGAHAMWVFDKGGALQSIQHALKYGDRPRYGVELGRLLGTSYLRAGWPAPDRVVPVPLHRLRLLERGYNQADMLARGVADTMAVPSDANVLIRAQSTVSQTTLSRDQRWSNVCSAFETRRSVEGLTCLLVDDVLTTGSTVMACAQTLRDSGAAKVYIATLCLARA